MEMERVGRMGRRGGGGWETSIEMGWVAEREVYRGKYDREEAICYISVFDKVYIITKL